jgi:hypothetical protein
MTKNVKEYILREETQVYTNGVDVYTRVVFVIRKLYEKCKVKNELENYVSDMDMSQSWW